MISALYDCHSGCSCISEASTIAMPATNETVVMESSIRSTVDSVADCTTVTVVSTYTSSCASASLEELTVPPTSTCSCMGNPDVHTTNEDAVNNTSSIKKSVEHSTETVTKTVVLTSTLSSFSCKDISTLLVTALPPSVDDLGYVETAECTRF